MTGENRKRRSKRLRRSSHRESNAIIHGSLGMTGGENYMAHRKRAARGQGENWRDGENCKRGASRRTGKGRITISSSFLDARKRVHGERSMGDMGGKHGGHGKEAWGDMGKKHEEHGKEAWGS